MKTIAPHYYPAFRCIADKCRHSCCIGWEIDIDPDTRERYRHVPGAFGARLNASIDDGEVSSFRLGEHERCPMLNANGLCDLITALGEDALCQICADHPRFRSHFTGVTEIGQGLCCEEAARIVLTQNTPMTLITLEDDGAPIALPEEEHDLLAERALAIAIMQEADRPLAERLDEVLALGGMNVPDLDWQDVYRGLERLDPAWDDALNRLPGLIAEPPQHLTDALTHFCVYLLYRHLPGVLEDDDLAGRIAFCVLSTRVLAALCAATPDCTLDECIEYARMYSAEVEYSEDNIAALLDALWED